MANALSISGKRTVFFCNGLEVPKEEAYENGRMLSYALGGVKVTVFHNRTDVSSYVDRTFSSDTTETFFSLSFDFAAQIQQSLTSKLSRAIVICHSDGANITRQAMEILTESACVSQVSIFSFGGATILEKRLASRVENYIFKSDYIALAGIALSSSSGTSSIPNKSVHVLPDPDKKHKHGFEKLIGHIEHMGRCHKFKSYQKHIIRVVQESLKPIDSGSRTKELEFREVPLTDMADFKVIFVKYHGKFKKLNHKRKAEGCNYERAKRQIVYLWNHKPELRHFILSELICASIQSSIEIDSTGRFIRLRKNGVGPKVFKIS